MAAVVAVLLTHIPPPPKQVQSTSHSTLVVRHLVLCLQRAPLPIKLTGLDTNLNLDAVILR